MSEYNYAMIIALTITTFAFSISGDLLAGIMWAVAWLGVGTFHVAIEVGRIRQRLGGKE